MKNNITHHMSDRKLIVPFKRHPYIGLFQYPWLPACARQAVRPSGYILPSNNPYIGFFNNAHREYRDVSQSTDIKKRDVYTQTDLDPALEIGEKIIKAYGEEYVVLLS